MRKLILGAALAISAAAPALAQIELGPVRIGPETREYIIREGRSSVVVDSDVSVGTVLPVNVELFAIETEPTYRYAVVNDRRVIVEPGSRRVLEIVD